MMEATTTIKMELSPEVLSTFEHLTRALEEHSNQLRIEENMRPDYAAVIESLGFHRCEVKADEPVTLLEDLRQVINRHSRENFSDTQDFVLAQYMMNCLSAFEVAVRQREPFPVPTKRT